MCFDPGRGAADPRAGGRFEPGCGCRRWLRAALGLRAAPVATCRPRYGGKALGICSSGLTASFISTNGRRGTNRESLETCTLEVAAVRVANFDKVGIYLTQYNM